MVYRYMTLTEAAEELGVSRERVRAWIASGKLRFAGVSEQGSFILSRRTVERDGRRLASEAKARSRKLEEATA